jgi:hypothetical protein
MITPPLSISANPDFTVKVPVSRCTGISSSKDLPGKAQCIATDLGRFGVAARRERSDSGQVWMARIEGGTVDDKDLIERINELANEEHELFQKESRGEVDAAERERIEQLQVTLDQCWDLLHQRRARRSAGLDPEDAEVRDARTVEGYVN